jgi:CubicO group peptidase (beta-lactamase class C family)
MWGKHLSTSCFIPSPVNTYLQTKKRHFFRAVETPQDLSEVTDIDTANEVASQQAGLSQEQVDKIWHSVEDFYRSGMHPGISFCLRRKDHIVLNRALGHARGVHTDQGIHPRVAMTTQTPACLYSASKAVSAMLIHKLAEENYIKLLDPISHYLPEFGKKGKKNISIYQMLAHRGGFPMLQRDVPTETLFDRQAILDEIYATESMCPDGRIQAYHAITSGFIIDELIRTTTGVTIQEYIKDKISDPMGMENFTYGVAANKRDKVALNYVTGMRNGKMIEGILSKAFGIAIDEAVELSNSDGFMDTIIPSANLYSTAEEINRFYQMLIDGGRYQGKSIFEPHTIQKATREISGMQIDKGIFLPLRFSAGFMMGGKPMGMYGINTHHAFGHLGFSNIFCWADPERDISVSIVSTGKPIIGTHILAIPKMIHAISHECAPCESMMD